MNLKKLNIELDIPAVQEILAIDLDEEPVSPLALAKEHMAGQIKKGLQPH